MLDRATADLAQELGRAPTLSELATELDLGPEEVSQGLLARRAYKIESIDRISRRGAGDEDDGALLDRLGRDDPGLEFIENHHTLLPLLATLSEQERTVLRLRFFGEMTQTQIAERIGVSQMQVSRILTRTLAQLREKFD
ncbi:RNA polymerase sigma factor SigF [Rhodococcus sp. T7]|nr:RNA polymerase sigma factor SigF [Rhodococcus sp. T7]KAF0962154.1 RNA polymerase sigma factor SigF [Rhodococcus sp. T7]